MDGKMFARLGAVVFVAVAITATAIELTRKEEAPASPSARPTESTSVDPLRDELIRCQFLGEAATRDAACLRAWAQNRERFLAPGARPAERLPEPPQPPRTTASSAATAPAEDNPIRKEAAPVMAPEPGEVR
jgi:conjugative transfer region protein TrbK